MRVSRGLARFMVSLPHAAASACVRASFARSAACGSPRSARTWINWRSCAARQAHPQAGAHVRAQLRLHARRGGQRPDRGQFAALPVEVVALEDVAEQVRLQELVDDGREVEHRVLDRPAGNLRLVGRAHGDQRVAGGNGPAGFAPRCILDAALLARFHHLQQLAQRVEALGEADVGVELHQDFLGLADGQARVQPLVQGGIELGHVAGGHEGRDQGDGLLLGGQRLGGGGCRGHGVRLHSALDGVARRDRQPQTQRQHGHQRVGRVNPSGRCIGHRSPSPSIPRSCRPTRR